MKPLPLFCLPALAALAMALLIAACGPAAAPGWTFAPIEPTPAASPGGSPIGSPGQSPAQSPGESPAQSPDQSPDQSPGEGLTLNVTTTQDDPLAFEPDQLSAPPASEVTIVYLNDSNQIHNIHFYAGQDQTAESLGATELATGPGAEERVTFATPEQPGDYLFVCDVHPDMTGTLTVED